MAMTSLRRWAILAAASFPSMVAVAMEDLSDRRSAECTCALIHKVEKSGVLITWVGPRSMRLAEPLLHLAAIELLEEGGELATNQIKCLRNGVEARCYLAQATIAGE